MWLRAHARKCRWEEEVILVEEEMRRTKETYLYEAIRWEGRGNVSGLNGGQKAWTAKQAALWKSLHSHAQREFSHITSSYVPPKLELDIND